MKALVCYTYAGMSPLPSVSLSSPSAYCEVV